MATKTHQPKIDASGPFYAAVGVADLTVEFARSAAAEAQRRLAEVDLEPRTLRDHALTAVGARVEDLQDEAKALPGNVSTYLDYTISELTDAYGGLTARGKGLVSRIRGQQATQDARAAGRSTAARAKTAKTQTTKSASQTARTAKKSAGDTRTAAKKTGTTAKRNTKATGTSARKTASASTKAASAAGRKVGD